MAGWVWFLITSAIVYGSFTAVGCVILIAYQLWQHKSLQKQKLKEEVDLYAQFVGEYHSALAHDPATKQRSLEVYAKTVWSPASVTNCRDYRRNCSETLSTTLYGDDQSLAARSPLPTGSASITSWSIYDDDREEFTSINSTPFYEFDGAEASSSRASSTSSPLSSNNSSPTAEGIPLHHILERPRLTLATMWPPHSCDTPTTATMSVYSQEEGITPRTATEYSPATSIGSDYTSYVNEQMDCVDPMGRASFETVGLGADGLYHRSEFDLEAGRHARSGRDEDCYGEDHSEEFEQQWPESVTRMTKKMSSAIQSLFVKGKTESESLQQQQQQQHQEENVTMRERVEV